MGLIKRLFIGLVLLTGSLPLIVGIALAWVAAVIPWIVFSIMAGLVRLVGVNSTMYTLPEFIDVCSRPFD